MTEIAVALVWRDGRLLIARRPAGVHLGGRWEFPGGKCEPGESPAECVRREVREELAIEVEPIRARPPIEYDYGDRQVRLHPFDCVYRAGEPHSAIGSEWRWVRPEELERFDFPPANEGLIRSLARGEGEG